MFKKLNQDDFYSLLSSLDVELEIGESLSNTKLFLKDGYHVIVSQTIEVIDGDYKERDEEL